MKLFEIAMPLEKAGFIPYVYEDGKPLFYFMVPSDSKFGGTQPCIAKGHVDRGETVRAAAQREASEELGLKASNIIPGTVKLVWKGKVEGKKTAFTMTVYMGEVRKKKDFNEPDSETGSTHWLTAKQFAEKGRKAQVRIVQAANRLLSR